MHAKAQGTHPRAWKRFGGPPTRWNNTVPELVSSAGHTLAMEQRAGAQGRREKCPQILAPVSGSGWDAASTQTRHVSRGRRRRGGTPPSASAGVGNTSTEQAVRLGGDSWERGVACRYTDLAGFWRQLAVCATNVAEGAQAEAAGDRTQQTHGASEAHIDCLLLEKQHTSPHETFKHPATQPRPDAHLAEIWAGGPAVAVAPRVPPLRLLSLWGTTEGSMEASVWAQRCGGRVLAMDIQGLYVKGLHAASYLGPAGRLVRRLAAPTSCWWAHRVRKGAGCPVVRACTRALQAGAAVGSVNPSRGDPCQVTISTLQAHCSNLPTIPAAHPLDFKIIHPEGQRKGGEEEQEQV